MEKLYNRTYWKNAPDNTTPISAENLDNMEAGIDGLDDRVVELKSDLDEQADILGYKELYDGTPYTLELHNGNTNQIFALNAVVKAHEQTKVSVNVYNDCIFNIYLISESKEILYIETASCTKGINDIVINYIPTVDCYIGITGEADTILYGNADSTINYATQVNSAPFEVGNYIGSLPSATSNSTAFSIKICVYTKISVLQGNVLELQEDVLELQDDMSDLKGATYSSEKFEYNENAGSIDPFMLLQPFPFDGNIRKLYFKQNLTQATVKVGIYDWDSEELTDISLNSTYTITVSNPVVDVEIPVKKGQYVGILDGVYNVCAWYNGASGAGFVYKPSSASPAKYVNKYITLAYDMEKPSLINKLEIVLDEAYPFEGKTIFLAGDSRSSMDYDFYGTTLSKKTGANVLVQGASGWTTAKIASDSYFSRLTSNPHDFSIWLVGGNDTGVIGSVGTFNAESANGKLGESVVAETDITADYNGTTFVQAVDHIMRKYKALFYDWKTLNNGHKPKMIFCTDIPQKRSGGSTTWSLQANWERKRNAIIECCEKNNIACLDLYKLCNFDMSYEPEWTSPTDKVNNNGLYFMDGLHPNEYGIDIITSLEVEELRKYLLIN